MDDVLLIYIPSFNIVNYCRRGVFPSLQTLGNVKHYKKQNVNYV